MTTINLDQAERYFGSFTQRYSLAAVRGLQSAGMRGVNYLVTYLIPSRTPQPVDRGVYRAGWRCTIQPDGSTIENNEPHAGLIEYGVRGANVKIGFRMISALAEWILRKGIATEDEAITRAWAIARSMQKRGIFNGGTGLNVLGELVERHLPVIIEEEITREIEREVP